MQRQQLFSLTTKIQFQKVVYPVNALIRGEDVALGRSVLVADDVAAVRLVVPFPQYKLKAERGYDFVYSSDNQDSFKIRILRQWLAEEVSLLED
ncbi:type 2 periplasmic-binding domain-containing protein [Klebsiella quasipneumoniae]|uniref:hypothetical protein n=1 Tax=Klebsiella quasipneumoniae TaxID=1463165 RepID=UPI0037BE847A